MTEFNMAESTPGMELRIEHSTWNTPVEDGEDEVHTESRTILRSPVADQDRWVTRLGVDEAGNFSATELRIEFEDHVIESSEGSKVAPVPIVVWNGEPALVVFGSTGALWAFDSTWRKRKKWVARAHDDWERWRTQSAAFREQWDFASFALCEHPGEDEA